MAGRTLPLIGVALVLVVVLPILVALPATQAVDRAIIHLVRDPALHDALGFLRPVTELGSTGAVTLAAGVALVLGLTVAPWRHGVIGAVTIGAASLGVEIVKAIVARERPDLLEPQITELGFSYPSGHATLSMVAYGIIGVLVARSIVAPATRLALVAVVAVLVFLIGLSRVWLGVHFPTDVVAGWMAGGIVVILFASLTRRVSTEPGVEVVDEDPGAPRSDPPAAG